MAKTRVYELARELNIESKALVAKLKDIGVTVSSHQSTLSLAQIDKIRAATLEQDKPTVVVRRRKKVEEEAVSEETVETLTADNEQSATKLEAEQEHSAEVSSLSQPSETKDKVEHAIEKEAVQIEAQALVHTALENQTSSHVENKETTQHEKQKQEDAKDQPKEQEIPRAQIVKKAQVNNDDAKSEDALIAESSNKASAVLEKASAVLESNEPGEKSFSSSSKDEELRSSEKIAARPSLVESNLPKGVSKIPTSTPSSFDALRQASMKKSAEESARLTAKKAPEKSAPRKPFIGATIVRKATPEEMESARALHENRNKKREDFPSRNTSQAVSGPPSKASQKLHGETVKAALAEDVFEASKWQGRSSEKKDYRRGAREEEEKPAVKLPASGKKRISSRDLLTTYQNNEDEEVLDGGVRKRRTIYTPGELGKKRLGKKRKDFKKTQITMPRAAYRVVKMEQATITVGELAKQLSIKASELITKLMAQGMMVNINHSLDFDETTLIASEYGFECKLVEKTDLDILNEATKRAVADKTTRPPIITVMGHVDHGKTSILDAIRESNIAGGESGGITQHIGAYMIDHQGFKVTFIDTPGHEAFSAMRARGAKVTDLVILVVAIDDGVKPQTIEAISHAQQAGVPIIVAVNKIDKPGGNIDRIYKELSEYGVQAEGWGGDVQFVKVSALKKLGLDELIEAIQIQSEMLELVADNQGNAHGVIIEAHLDKGKGPVATMIITEGKLRVGDCIVAGTTSGKVRVMEDHNGRRLTEAGPSVPVKIFGLDGVPMAGDQVNCTEEEKTARQIVEYRLHQKGRNIRTTAAASLEDLIDKVSSQEIPQLPLIIKADTQGSVEAIASALARLNSAKVRNVIVHRAVGGINETDINLSDASGAVILGFNVRANSGLNDIAEKRGVVIKYYSIIYELLDAVKSLMTGKLPPVCTEVIQGHAEVRETIPVPKVGVVAGSSVIDGKITRSSALRLIRDQIVVYTGKVGSLRRFKEDVREVQNGYECGIAIEGCTDVKVGDVIEAFMVEEKPAVLEFNL